MNACLSWLATHININVSWNDFWLKQLYILIWQWVMAVRYTRRPVGLSEDRQRPVYSKCNQEFSRWVSNFVLLALPQNRLYFCAFGCLKHIPWHGNWFESYSDPPPSRWPNDNKLKGQATSQTSLKWGLVGVFFCLGQTRPLTILMGPC